MRACEAGSTGAWILSHLLAAAPSLSTVLWKLYPHTVRDDGMRMLSTHGMEYAGCDLGVAEDDDNRTSPSNATASPPQWTRNEAKPIHFRTEGFRQGVAPWARDERRSYVLRRV